MNKHIIRDLMWNWEDVNACREGYADAVEQYERGEIPVESFICTARTAGRAIRCERLGEKRPLESCLSCEARGSEERCPSLKYEDPSVPQKKISFLGTAIEFIKKELKDLSR